MPIAQRQEKEKAPPIISDEVALVISAALLATWIGFLLWSSLASHFPALPRFLAWDKLQHLLAYAILMLLSGRFFKLLFDNRIRSWIFGFIFTIGFGLLMEIAQEALTTSRHADWMDLAANSLGAGLILLIALMQKKKRT